MNRSEIKIERIITYRRILLKLYNDGEKNIFSYQLANKCQVSSAQVRRDLMDIGYSGSPANGYEVQCLIKSIAEFIDPDKKQGIALVGLGNLGRAIIDYFNGQSLKLEIVALFDKNPNKINRVIAGCHSYHINDLKEIIIKNNIKTAVISVPSTDAQQVADVLVDGGIKGILNYAPIILNVPDSIYVQNRDMITTLEKVSYFANYNNK